MGVHLTAVRQPQISATLGSRWGTAVANRRRVLGFSQAELAELCSVTQQTISKIEAGRMIPHDRLKLVIANRMGIDPGALFTWPPRAELIEGAA